MPPAVSPSFPESSFLPQGFFQGVSSFKDFPSSADPLPSAEDFLSLFSP
jgi:hypothetical protein